jgi:MFS transporter, PAT family, beta-lactamase induction signal transducer AmpG
MFSTVLTLRLQAAGVALAVLGFFGWVQLLPTFKFLWAPLLDRLAVPGFSRFYGRRRGWILLSQLGSVSALCGLGLARGSDLPVVALFAVLLAFWTTTLEVAADAWRIELAPTQAEQGPIAAANVWGYRTAMVAAGSGALLLADQPALGGWTLAYLAVAIGAFLPFPALAASAPEPGAGGGRAVALATGIAASVILLALVALAVAALGWALLAGARAAGVTASTDVLTPTLLLCMTPFLLLAAAVPWLKRLPADAPLLRSAGLGPYADFFWRYGAGALLVVAFVPLYRMGDVLALNWSKPMIRDLGYSLTEIGRADTLVALLASLAGVALGGWLVTRRPVLQVLALAAVLAGLGNLGFVWLAHQPRHEGLLYLATGLDQFGNGMAGTVFVVYLSLLVNPRHPGAQFAFLSGFAFLLPRLLSGAGGRMIDALGYDGFFLLSGALSLAVLPLLPLLARLRLRADA